MLCRKCRMRRTRNNAVQSTQPSLPPSNTPPSPPLDDDQVILDRSRTHAMLRLRAASLNHKIPTTHSRGIKTIINKQQSTIKKMQSPNNHETPRIVSQSVSHSRPLPDMTPRAPPLACRKRSRLLPQCDPSPEPTNKLHQTEHEENPIPQPLAPTRSSIGRC